MGISDWRSDVGSSDLRLDRDAGEAHVEQQKADPRLRLALVRGADEREHAVREMRVRRPYLRSIEDIILAIGHRAQLQRGKVRSRAGLRKALAPIILARQDARQLKIGRASCRERVWKYV